MHRNVPTAAESLQDAALSGTSGPKVQRERVEEVLLVEEGRKKVSDRE